MNKQDAKLYLISRGLRPPKRDRVLLSFSYPYSLSFKLKRLREVYGWGGVGELFDNIIDNIGIKNYLINCQETASHCEIKTRTYSHRHYRYNSLAVKQETFQKLKTVAVCNNVTASAIVRRIITELYEGVK